MTARDLVHIGWFLLGPAPKLPSPTAVQVIRTPVGALRAVTYTPTPPRR